ncbi:hypothetical protein [Saccharopolyspora shandongensis]|uniref:hypothetical protein n=1 Tax=Saccharopolyspora shandongensis TaxID=418495 RepID=UPI0033BFECDE
MLQHFERTEVRADVQRLVALIGLLAWSDDDNHCGIRYRSDEQKSTLTDKERVALFSLAQHIQGAGEWADGTDTGTSGRTDAMDLPLIAFHVATGASEPVRRVLGEILAHESLLYTWDNHDTTSMQVFDAWAEQVHPLAFRLATTFRHRYNDGAKPWTR